MTNKVFYKYFSRFGAVFYIQREPNGYFFEVYKNPHERKTKVALNYLRFDERHTMVDIKTAVEVDKLVKLVSLETIVKCDLDVLYDSFVEALGGNFLVEPECE